MDTLISVSFGTKIRTAIFCEEIRMNTDKFVWVGISAVITVRNLSFTRVEQKDSYYRILIRKWPYQYNMLHRPRSTANPVNYMYTQ